MAKAPPPNGISRTHRAKDAAVRGLIATTRAVPYGARVRGFGALTSRILAPVSKLGRRIDENLSFVYPEMPPAERARLGRASADSTGRMMIELLSWRDLDRRMAEVTPTGPGWPAFQEAQAGGRSVLLMSAHFGNYVAARACLIRKGYDVAGFYRPMQNPHFNKHYFAAMAATGGPGFTDTPAGTKSLIRFLRAGGSVMLLNDLYVGSGIELPFLGRPAMTSTAPAEIARRTDTLMIPIWGIRKPDGLGFDVELDAPLPMNDPAETTRAYNAAVEARVRAHPEQWFWMHRRWKKKWNDGKGLEGDLHPAQLPSRRSAL